MPLNEKEMLTKLGITDGSPAFDQAMKQINNLPSKNINVQELIAQKKALNDMGFEALSDTTQRNIRRLKKGIDEDLAAVDKAFSKAKTIADKYNTKLENRKRFDSKLNC